MPAGYRAEPQAVRFALVSADGRRVTVSTFGGGCTRTGHLSADESADRVVVDLETYTFANATTCTSDARVWTESTTLAGPLDGRTLYDHASGKRVAYFDGRRLAAVGWLPPGAASPIDRPMGTGWERKYQFPRQHTAAPVKVTQTPTTAARPPYTPNPMLDTSPARVHGRPAMVVTQRGDGGVLVQARVLWVERGYAFAVDSMPEWAWQRPLTVSRLLRVAGGLRLPG